VITFVAEHPEQFEGVGNAIPPVWAAAVLRELL